MKYGRRGEKVRMILNNAECWLYLYYYAYCDLKLDDSPLIRYFLSVIPWMPSFDQERYTFLIDNKRMDITFRE